MPGFNNIGKAEYFKRYGVKYGSLRALFMLLPLHYVNDYENKKLLYYKKVQKKLRKEYINKADIPPKDLRFGNREHNDVIWIYWKQGFENAPKLVRACCKSVKQYSGNRKVICLSDDNIQDYLILPQSIVEKNICGKISNAALSDLIRYSLLEHYGGTWLDATVLLTGELPEYAVESDFFAYKDFFGLAENPALISNWFIHSKKGNELVRKTRNMAFAYWENNNYVCEYLNSYIFLTIAEELTLNDHGSFPAVDSFATRQLFNNLGAKFDDNLYRHITRMSGVHKLTNKLDKETLDSNNTFYAHILEEFGE